MHEPVLEVRGLSRAYGQVVALDGVDLDLAAGEVVALVGENGAGKTTLVQCIARTQQPQRGTVAVRGRSVGHTPADARRAGISVVWQDLALCDNLAVVENLFLGRELGRATLAEGAMRAAAQRLLDDLGIPIADLGTPVGQLSGGQRQAVAVARAVLERPAVLLLDEPTSALGVTESRAVRALIHRLASDGIAILLVTHRLEEAFEVAGRIVVLRRGRVTADVSRLEVHPDDIAALLAGARTDTSARQQLRRLHSLVDQLSAADPSVVLPLTVSAMANALGVEMVCVFLVDDGDPDQPRLVRSAAVGMPPELLAVNKVLELGPAGGSSGDAAARLEVVVVEDLLADPLWEPFRDAVVASGVRSTWAVPIVGVDGLLGVVAGYATAPGRPQDDQLELVSLFASQAAAALDRGSLLTELTARNSVLETLRAVLETLAGPEPIAGGTGIALLALCRGLRADATALYAGTGGEVRCHDAMAAEPATPEAVAAAQRAADAAAERLRAEAGDHATRVEATVATARFASPLGDTVLVAAWAIEGAVPADAAAILTDAATSFRLALEREHVAAAEQETAALRRSRDLQRAFVSRLSHELRTPLTAIHGYATSLRQHDVAWPAADQERFLGAIAAESGRLTRLVGDLLDSSAIEAGILRLQRDWCDVPLVLEAAAAATPGAPDVVLVEVLDDVEAVWADHDRLEQVFVNLLANALKHNPAGTKVEVEVMRGLLDGTVAVRVRDEGDGLPDAVVRWLLADPAEDTAVERLGLRIARGIVEAHGGALTVEHRRRGASLLVTLPVGGEEAEEAP